MLLAIALAAAVASTDPAAPPPTTVAAATVQGQKDGDKIICRNEPITGSRFVKHVCLKKFQWDQRDRDTDQLEHGMQDRSGLVGARGGIGAGPAGPF